MATMMAETSATARDADQRPGRTNERPTHCCAMALQSTRGYEAAPQTFVRLTGSHFAKPRVARGHSTAGA
jgi:hypothetical protein